VTLSRRNAEEPELRAKTAERALEGAILVYSNAAISNAPSE
jgi:hypothetical protein